MFQIPTNIINNIPSCFDVNEVIHKLNYCPNYSLEIENKKSITTNRLLNQLDQKLIELLPQYYDYRIDINDKDLFVFTAEYFECHYILELEFFKTIHQEHTKIFNACVDFFGLILRKCFTNAIEEASFHYEILSSEQEEENSSYDFITEYETPFVKNLIERLTNPKNTYQKSKNILLNYSNESPFITAFKKVVTTADQLYNLNYQLSFYSENHPKLEIFDPIYKEDDPEYMNFVTPEQRVGVSFIQSKIYNDNFSFYLNDRINNYMEIPLIDYQYWIPNNEYKMPSNDAAILIELIDQLYQNILKLYSHE